MVALILVDSNVWIFFNVENYPEHLIAEKRIIEVRKEGIVINDIILSEVFHKLSLILGKGEALLRTKKMLDSADVSYVSIDELVVRKAIELAVYKSTRINDAIIAEQSLELHIPVLTDNVKDFKKVKGLEVVALK